MQDQYLIGMDIVGGNSSGLKIGKTTDTRALLFPGKIGIMLW